MNRRNNQSSVEMALRTILPPGFPLGFHAPGQFRDEMMKSFTSSFASRPAADVRKLEDGRVEISLDVPSLKKEDISVTVENKRLLISGRVSESYERSDEGYFIRERSSSAFSRGFTVGDIEEEVEATLANGVLVVVVTPRDRKAASRVVEVKEGATATPPAADTEEEAPTEAPQTPSENEETETEETA